jgi:biopolymer transport protein TolR
MGFSSSSGDFDESSGGGGDFGSSLKSEINVTPLVDVMLVLLVIFMVTAPMMQQGVEVSLPKTSNNPISGSDEQLVLSVDDTGKIFIGAGNQVSLEEVGKKTAAILASRPPEARKAYIKADAKLQYQVVMDLMGRLHQSGVTQIGLMSAPLD